MSPIRTETRSSRFRASRLTAGIVTVGLVGAGVFGASPAFAAEPGGQGSGDSLFPNVGNTGYDVSHYDIDLAYDHDDGSIVATTEIAATATVELSSFSLDFEGLTVGSVLVNGAPAPYERVVDVDATKHKLVITPATPLTGAFTTEISYSGVPTTHIDPDTSSEGWVPTPDGATAVSEPVGAMTWFPSNNTPLDKATFDFAFTIPTEIDGGPAAAAGNGELVSRISDPVAGTTTWSWEQRELMATYLSLVSIGRYDVYEAEIVLEASGRTIPEWSFIDPTVGAQALEDSLASRAELGTILNALEAKFGRYPGNSTGIVVDGAQVGYALETQDRAFYDTSADLGTTIHETVHQWFGNAVSAQDWSDIWLNEGPAELFTYDVLHEEFNGPTAESELYELWTQIPATSSFWTVPVAGFDDPADLFGAPTYYRSSMALEALRLSIGDEDFAKIYPEWYLRFDDGDAKTADFIALAEEISGEELDAFFQDWLFDLDKPEWPDVWTLTASADPAPGEELVPGDEVEYTLDAANTGLGALSGVTATVDLTGVLPSADIDETELPAGLSLTDSTLTWTVPDVAAGSPAASVSFTASVSDEALAPVLALTAAPVGLGATCLECEVVHTIVLPALSPIGEASITGAPVVGETLTVDPGVWAAEATLEYQWFRFAEADQAALEELLTGETEPTPEMILELLEPVAGATGPTYEVQPGDVGYAFFAVVVGTAPGYQPGVSITAPTAFVAAPLPSPTPTQTPTSSATPMPAALANTGADSAPLAGAAWAAGLLFAFGVGAMSIAIRRRRAERV